MILVDTSAWIDFFRGNEPISDVVDECLEANLAVICGPVITELRRGFRSPKERAQVISLLAGCRELPQPSQLWEDAGDLGFLLRKKGKTIKTMDILIASYAMAFGASILTSDREFHHLKSAGLPLDII